MKDFLKYTLASLLGNLLGLVLLATMGLGGLIFLIIAAASQDSGTVVKDKSVLVLDLATDITDTDPNSSTAQALQEALSETTTNQIKLRRLLKSLEAASQDDNIVALYLKGNSSPINTGFANLKEVREGLQKFRDAGKEIVAYDMDWTEPEYYLGSVANQVVINPLGSMEMNGLSANMMFLSGAFEKYGIGVQVTRVGKYKSAVEPFVLKQMSPENRQQTQQLLNDLWGEWVESIAPSRKLTTQQLQNLVNQQGVFLASEAQKNKFVDQVAYFDEIAAKFKALTGEPKDEDQPFRQISLAAYSHSQSVHEKIEGDRLSNNKVAVVYAEGEIVDGVGLAGQIGGESLAKELRKLRLDEDVKAVVMRVNSPGGSATASEVIGREVELIRQKKPVVVSMGNYAASGGYWISMQGSKILAEPNTITGSIGVFGLLFNIQGISNNNGITWDSVKTGKFADLDAVSRPKTPEELAQIQKFVDVIYERFLTNVAESRNLPKAKVQDIAQGRVWSGEQAKQIGLVDEIGGLEDAIALAIQEAKLGEDWQLEEHPKTQTLEEKILTSFAGGANAKSPQSLDPLTQEFLKLQKELAALKAFNDPRGIYTRLPFSLRIE